MAGFPDGFEWQLDPSGPVVGFEQGPLRAEIFEDTGHFQLIGPDLSGTAAATTVVVTPPAVGTATGPVAVGRVLSSSPVAGGRSLRQAAGPAEIQATLTFLADGVLRYEVQDWGSLQPQQTAIAGASTPGEHFYGLGEKFDSLDQSGKRVDVLTFDDPGPKNDHSYKVAPWFISTRGYGFHLDSSAESTFDLGAGAPGRFVVANQVGALALNLVYGPALTDVLTRYTAYMGRPPLPPPWAFGPWISSDVWSTGGEVRYAVTQFRDFGIPASGFVFDSPWESAYNDFKFNLTQFGQDFTFEGVHYPGFNTLTDMMDFLRGHGLKAICWMAPLVNIASIDEHIPGQNLGEASNYAEGAVQGFFVRSAPGGPPLVVTWWKGRGSPVDFTNPNARAWLQDQLQLLLTQSHVQTAAGQPEPAIGGFKTDDGESGNGPNVYIPTTAAYADGRKGVEMRNGYCLEYHRSVWSVLGAAGIVFARSGFAGSHAFPGYWAGDNEPNFGDNGLPSVIVAGLSAAMSAYSIWGHDIGGYQDTNPSQSPPNLFMRWAQFGCFSPIMQMHRQVARQLQYPWRYGPEALANYQFFARLHVRLFPYIYTYAQIASMTGLPIIRPLVLLDQGDPNTFAVNHTYRFGNELLVAPMLTPDATTRNVYLPHGDWIDFWNHSSHPGGQTLTWTNANQSQLPLFVRAGAVIPMLPTDVDTLCDANYVNDPAVTTRGDDLLFQVYPAGASSFRVFDGTQVQCQGDANGGTVTVTAAARHIVVRILANAPDAVQLNGAPLAEAPAQGAPGWRFDATAGFLEVDFSHPGGGTTIDY